MRYLLIVRVPENGMPEGGPSPELIARMDRLITEERKAGVLLDTGGLRPIEEASRVRLSHGRVTTTDGPFSEAKEVVGGFAMVEVPDRKAAEEAARRFLAVHGNDWEVEIEVRLIEGP